MPIPVPLPGSLPVLLPLPLPLPLRLPLPRILTIFPRPHSTRHLQDTNQHHLCMSAWPRRNLLLQQSSPACLPVGLPLAVELQSTVQEQSGSVAVSVNAGPARSASPAMPYHKKSHFSSLLLAFFASVCKTP